MASQVKNRLVRVRIAPSPTGFAHVGTAYTALFNYAFAKKNRGKFIIRVEDTDIKRNVQGAEKAIFDGLRWLGLKWEESTDVGGKYGPYRQSDRLDIYKEKIQQLLNKKMAYEDEGAVRFRNSKENVGWKDLIRGEINFPGDQITDFVIQKSDGYPTYNFAVVVDDIAMKISHVIRGEEHISNTPRQLALYKAFKTDPPFFAHHPTLRNKEHKKLSKRRDPVDLRIFKEKGYLPEALVNFLCLLGWSHPDEKEIFNLREFVKLFSLDRVRKAGPIFNIDKLDWINGEYFRRLSDEEFVKRVKPFAPKNATAEKLLKVAPLVKDRIKKLSEFNNLAGFIFDEQEPARVSSVPEAVYAAHISNATQSLMKVDDWGLNNINNALSGTISDNDFNTGDFYMDLRTTVSGSRSTPPINESIQVVGKEATLKQLEKGLSLHEKGKLRIVDK